MNLVANEVVSVLVFLLPGIVAAAIFFSLTSHPRPREFERVIQALIFTLIGQAIIAAGLLFGVPPLDRRWELLVPVLIAMAIGLIAAGVSNHDLAHRVLRYIGFTKETSYPSEWYSAFARNPDCYVVLHLKGERRLYGWPVEWPSHSDQGHFRIAEGEWLIDDKRQPATGVSAILVPASEVEMVEFLRIVPADEITE